MFPNQYLTVIVCSAFNLVANTMILVTSTATLDKVINRVALELLYSSVPYSYEMVAFSSYHVSKAYNSCNIIS